MEPNTTNMPAKKSQGMLIGSIVVIIILIIGGVYLHRQNRMLREEKMNQNMQAPIDDSAYEQNQGTQSSSDDVTSIEADANATNFDSLDEGL